MSNKPPPTVALLTLGCKLNIADSEAMARSLRAAGWQISDNAAGVDAVILNSCSVTGVADRKSRGLARRARRLAPQATIALTGCMIETASSDTVAALGADLVYRQVDQQALAAHLIELRPIDQGVRAQPVFLKTRGFVSAQEGCNDVCAFCVIPKTRGRERSKPIATIIQESKELESEGTQEIVITGTQLGAFGAEEHGGIYQLLATLLEETSVPRIRLSSLQPQHITKQLLELWQDPRLCRHFHLALQSGSDPVLVRMRRRYTTSTYSEAIDRLRLAIPGVAITTDIIAGFPGETETEFENSFDFAREQAFAKIHVFPFSERTGTLAAKMPGQVPEPIKHERVGKFRALAAELSEAYRTDMLGSSIPVLWETQREGAVWEGLTDTYVSVHVPSDEDLYNCITPVTLTGLTEDYMLGEAAN